MAPGIGMGAIYGGSFQTVNNGDPRRQRLRALEKRPKLRLFSSTV
jgi:hypothetical protein